MYLKGIADKVNNLKSKEDCNLINIDIEKLTPNKNNFYGIREIEELVEDIKLNGLYHNLVVRPIGDKYEIISGERRYRALLSLGYIKVPCQVRTELKDIDAEIMLIQANARGRELTTAEKIKQVQRLAELYKLKKENGEKLLGKTRDIIGDQMGISGAQVQRYIKIANNLEPEIKEELFNEKISVSVAETIAGLPKEQQHEAYNMVKAKNINRDEARDKIKGAHREHFEDTYKNILCKECNGVFKILETQRKGNIYCPYCRDCIKEE